MNSGFLEFSLVRFRPRVSAVIYALCIGASLMFCNDVAGSDLDQKPGVRIGFVELWAGASHFDGELVQVSGYVVRGLGQTLLYPDKDYFEFQSGLGGLNVYLEGDAALVFSRMRERREAGDWRYELACPALITGIYRHDNPRDYGSLGYLMSDSSKVVITDSCDGVDTF